jgi:hypothetical protein
LPRMGASLVAELSNWPALQPPEEYRVRIIAVKAGSKGIIAGQGNGLTTPPIVNILPPI